MSFVSLWALGFPNTYNLSVFSPSLCLLYHCEHLAFLLLIICQSFPLLCVFCIIVSTWLSYYLWFVSPFRSSVSFVSLRALGFPTTYDLSVFSPSLCLLYHCEHLAFLLPMICQYFPLLCVFCIIVSTWLSYYLWFVSLFPFSVSFVSLWALDFAATYDLSVFSPPLCLLYHCEHLAFVLPMICQSFPLLCVFCIIVSTWLSYYLWFVSLFHSSVSFVSLWALGFPTTYDLSVFPPPLCLLYHCEHLTFLLPMICQSFPLCVFCIIVSTWLFYNLWFVSLFPSSVSFVSLWALSFPTTYDLSVFSPLCLLYHCEHLAFLLPMICQSFPLLCVFCIIVSTWLSYYLWFVSLFPSVSFVSLWALGFPTTYDLSVFSPPLCLLYHCEHLAFLLPMICQSFPLSVSFVSLWALGFPTTYDLSVFSPPLCLLYHCEHLAFLLPMICQSFPLLSGFPLLCVFCIIVSTWLSYYLWFVSLFPFSVSFVSLWALGFPTTYDLSVFSPSLCLLYHCEHLAFLLPMICQSFPLLCVFCIIVSTWLSYYLWFVSLFPFSVSFVSLWALGFPTTYDLSVFSPSLCLLYHCEHLAFLLHMICQSFPLLCVFCIIVSTWLSYYLWFVSLFPSSVSFVSLWALGFPTTYDLSVFSPPLCLLYHCEHLTFLLPMICQSWLSYLWFVSLCLLYHCEHLAFLLPMICQSFSLLCVFCIIVSTCFPTTYDLSVFSPLCLLYHCEHLAFLLPMICQSFPLLCVFCIIVSTWLSTTYDLSVFSPSLCLLYHCEHLAFLLPMICQSFPLLCVFCIIVSTWLSYYLWFVSLFPSSVSFVSLWALGFPTTYDLSVFSPSLCLLYHCEHLTFLLPMICQSFPLLCVFCIIVSTWLSYYLWFVSPFPSSVSFVSLWALGFPTTYDLSVFSPPLCLLYHCEHLAFLLPMICQYFPLLCVFCIIVSTWLSYYLWFVSLLPSVSFVSLWALGFPTTYDLSVFSPPLCLLYHCEHLAFLLPMICQSFHHCEHLAFLLPMSVFSPLCLLYHCEHLAFLLPMICQYFPLLCVFCIIVSTWISYYLWFVSLFPFSVSFVSLWALGFPTTYDLSVFSPPLCLLYHCEHLAFLLPMICQSFPLLCVFCIIVSTWLSYYLWFVSLFPFSVSFVSLWALDFAATYDLSVFSPPLCLLYHCEHLAFLLLIICSSLFPFSVSFVSLWALGFPTTYDLSVFSPSLCLLYHCEHLAFLLPMICQSFPLLCVFCIIVSTWLSYYLWFVSLFPLCVFCIIVSTWLSYYLWFVSLFPSSVSFVSLWALGFPTTYDLSVFSPSLCLLYHCEHLTFLLPMICQSFPLCVFCIIVSTWLPSPLCLLYTLSVFSPPLCLLYHCEHLDFLLPMICQSFPLLCVFCIIVSTWLSYYLWFVSLFPSVSFVSLWALGFPTTYDLSVFSPPLCLLYHCEHFFLLPMICQSFPLSVSFVSLWALGFPTTYDLSVFSPSLCLLYHCEHLTFLLPMICQSFPLLCVFCIIVSTWLSYYLWFVSLFPFSVSFVSLWALGFPTTYDLSVFSPPLCLLYHCEHLAFLLPMICQSFPLLCVFCIIVSTWLCCYIWFVSLFPSSVSFVSLWALGFPTTYDLSVLSPPLCLLYHCEHLFPTTYDLSVFSPPLCLLYHYEHLAFLLPMICQSFPLLCVFCIIVSTCVYLFPSSVSFVFWLSYYLWFVSLFPSVSFVSLWALGFPTTYDLSVFSPPLCLLYHCEHLCLLYHCEHLAFLLPMICQSFPLLCVFCIIVSTWLSYYLWFVSLFPSSVSFVSLWALGFPTTYDLSVFSPLCLLYHCEHLAFLLPMICQSFPLLCVFCIIVSTWLSYYLWFVSLFPSVSFVSLWALGFPTTYDLSVFSPSLCLLYHCEHLTFLLPMICQSFPLSVSFVSLWALGFPTTYDLSVFSPFPLSVSFVSLWALGFPTTYDLSVFSPSSVSFVSLWALGFPTTYDLSVFSPSLCLLYHCEHLTFLLPMICQSFPLCVFCIIVSTWLLYHCHLSFVSLWALVFSPPLCLLYHCEHFPTTYDLSVFSPLCVFCIIVSTWLSYYWFVSLFPSSVSFVSLWALGFPTTYDLSVFSPPLCLLYHCEHLCFPTTYDLSVFSPLCVFCIIVSTWLSYYLWFVSLFPSSVSFVSLWALDFPTTYDLSVFSPLCLLYHCEHLAFLLPMICQSFPLSVSFVSLWALDFPTTYDLSVFSPLFCIIVSIFLLYHCEHLAFLLPMICQSFPLLCVFCIIVSTWLSYYLWFVSLFPFSVSFVSLWALGFPTTYDLSVFSPSLCLLYHCEHLAFLLPMICQSFPLLCVFCIIVSTWLSYYLWFVSLFPSVSFVSLWALGFPTTYDLSVFSPSLCLLYHCEHLTLLLHMICQSFPLLCVFCIIVSTWLSYYLWFVSLFPSSVSFVSLWALGFPTTYDLSVFSPPLCLLYHCEHLAFLLPMICQYFPLLCVFCIIVSTWLSYYLWFVSLFPFPLCLLYHCEHLAFLLPMICQSFPLCVFCIIVSTWLSYYLWFVSLFPSSVSFVSLWALGFPTTYEQSFPLLCVFCIIVSTWLSYYLWFVSLFPSSVSFVSLWALWLSYYLWFVSLFPLCVFCIIVSTWLSYYLWFVSLFPFSVSFVSLWALDFPTTYDLSVFSPLCVFCIIVSTWLSYYLWFVSLFPFSVSFVSLWALGFPTTYDLSVFSPSLCLLYHCEHLTFLLPMICQSFPLCVFCIIVSTWLSYYLWFVSLFPFSVSFVSLWALDFPTTYDLSVFSPPLCLLYHCEHLAFLLPMICQSFPLLCVFCIIVSTWLSYYLWFVSLFPSSVSFVSLWALGFPTTYDLSVFSPPLCLLYHCEHLAFLLPMICQSFPLLCVFCIIVSTWLSYYLWFVSLFPSSVSFVSLWALGFPTTLWFAATYDLSVFSPPLCIIVSTWLSYYLWSFVSLWALGFPTTYDLSVFSPPLCLLYHCEHLTLSVFSPTLWALGFPTTYDLSVFSPPLCLLYHCEHLAFLLPMICQSFPLLCVFCIIVSTWLSYYLWFVSLFPCVFCIIVSTWATYDLSVFSPLCLLYHCEHLAFLLPMICQSFPLLCVFCIIVSTWLSYYLWFVSLFPLCVFCIIVSTWLSYYLWFVSLFPFSVSFVSLWALGFPTTYDLSVFSPSLCLLYHCEHLAFLLPMICQSFPLLCVFCIIVSTWLSYYLWFVSLFPSVSFVSLWALGFPTTYDLSVYHCSPFVSLCLLYHCEHLTLLLHMICQSFSLLCVFCIIVSTWLSYYLWFVSLFPSSVSFVSLWALGFPTTYDLSVFSPPLCLLYHCEHLAFLLPMICQYFPSSVSFVSLWALGFPTTYDLSVFSPLCLLYHCEHLAFLLPMICQSFPLLCVFCIIVST